MNEKFSKENLIKNRDLKKLSEHLIEGVKPIMVCLGTDDELGRIHEDSYPNAHNIKYTQYDENGTEKVPNIKNARWAMSKVDDLNKFSLDFFRCEGLVVVGTEKKTNKNISFLGHQDPHFFLESQKSDFESSIAESLTEMKQRCIPGTIDAILAGGTFPPDSTEEKDRYLDAIQSLSSLVKNHLGFEPVIVNGPKDTELRVDDIYFENENRRLYLTRPKVNSEIGSFTASDIKQEKLPTSIELATTKDWQTCKELMLEAFKSEDADLLAVTPLKIDMEEKKTKEEWEADLSNDSKFVLLSRSGSEVAGISSAEDEEERGYWYAHTSYVKPKYRGEGLGKKMFAARLNEILRRGGEKVRLDVNPENTKNIHIAETFGFKKMDWRPDGAYWELKTVNDPEVIKKINEVLNA